MRTFGQDSLQVKRSVEVTGKAYHYYSIPEAAERLGVDFSRLPFSLKVLLENLLRYEDGKTVKQDDVQALASWLNSQSSSHEIAYRPARVLMQDFTGVPAVVDLAAMRDAMANLGSDPKRINPLSAVDLVIDHSVQVDQYANDDAFNNNVDLEMRRNHERYAFLRWGQTAFDNFRVVPPGTGICHQVNLEYLAKVVWTETLNGEDYAYPDTLVGTDSHTTMVNGLGVLGWGVGGIEAEAVMLGQPISMLIPEVIGFKLTGELKEGTTATDLVLTVTQMLRERGVVGKFVEFYGEGLTGMPLADRATISNMAPEYGATCGIFPIDEETLKYMALSGRDEAQIALTRAYAKAQGFWRDESNEPVFTDTLKLDMGTVEPSMAGPKRPQDRIVLSQASDAFGNVLKEHNASAGARYSVESIDADVGNGDVVIAAITSCTNTSNPSVMMAAGLVARKARALGLTVKPWVKTSLAPGSKVVTEYLEKAGLQDDLDAMGFNLVGYGCTTCIGNSGPLLEDIESTIKGNDLVVTSVLSGNRNFEGRVHPLVKANYLASPPLVVAYALAGSMLIDLANDPIGQGSDGQDVYLKDIWPSNQEIQDIVLDTVSADMFNAKYADVFSGEPEWQSIETTTGMTYGWQSGSTYVQNPPYFEGMKPANDSNSSDIEGAHILALLGDSVTTDHISPAGSIAKNSPAANYLAENGVEPAEFNSYGSRRGNHEVMMRGTFANIRIRNEMLDNVEGGYTKHVPSGEQLSIYDASMRYQLEGTPLVVVAGKEYGTGSSRDWAAKGTRLLGVKAVITESFERIHRSNLVGMGVLPLMFTGGDSRKSLNLTGAEKISITGIANGIQPGMNVGCSIEYPDGNKKEISLLCRIDTAEELEYFNNGGILQYVIRNLMQDTA
jgi:aconitate hydratase